MSEFPPAHMKFRHHSPLPQKHHTISGSDSASPKAFVATLFESAPLLDLKQFEHGFSEASATTDGDGRVSETIVVVHADGPLQERLDDHTRKGRYNRKQGL